MHQSPLDSPQHTTTQRDQHNTTQHRNRSFTTTAARSRAPADPTPRTTRSPRSSGGWPERAGPRRSSPRTWTACTRRPAAWAWWRCTAASGTCAGRPPRGTRRGPAGRTGGSRWCRRLRAAGTPMDRRPTSRVRSGGGSAAAAASASAAAWLRFITRLWLTGLWAAVDVSASGPAALQRPPPTSMQSLALFTPPTQTQPTPTQTKPKPPTRGGPPSRCRGAAAAPGRGVVQREPGPGSGGEDREHPGLVRSAADRRDVRRGVPCCRVGDVCRYCSCVRKLTSLLVCGCLSSSPLRLTLSASSPSSPHYVSHRIQLRAARGQEGGARHRGQPGAHGQLQGVRDDVQGQGGAAAAAAAAGAGRAGGAGGDGGRGREGGGGDGAAVAGALTGCRLWRFDPGVDCFLCVGF